MSPIFIANWKMNFLKEDALNFLDEILPTIDSSNLIVAPPTPYIALLSERYQKVKFAAQDVSINKDFGAYTGEYSTRIVRSTGARYAIVGHSERRSNLHETNYVVRTKVENCIDAGLIPILCIGETLESRQNNNYPEFIQEQLQESLPADYQDIVIAYEPIWAIGTGITPNTVEITEVMQQIKAFLTSSAVAKNIKLVYGGSVNSANYQEILAIDDISGLLMGGVSLDAKALSSIIKGE